MCRTTQDNKFLFHFFTRRKENVNKHFTLNGSQDIPFIWNRFHVVLPTSRKPVPADSWFKSSLCLLVVSVKSSVLSSILGLLSAVLSGERASDRAVQPGGQRLALLPDQRRRVHHQDGPAQGGQVPAETAAWVLHGESGGRDCCLGTTW